MTLMNITYDKIDKLFEEIDACIGKVELVGKDIRLNLKSKLAQYVSLAKIFSNGEIIKELELLTYNQKDTERLMKFLIGEYHA